MTPRPDSAPELESFQLWAPVNHEELRRERQRLLIRWLIAGAVAGLVALAAVAFAAGI